MSNLNSMARLNLISFAVFQGTLMGLIGLCLGIIYSFGGAIIDLLVSLSIITSTETPGLSIGTLLAFMALIGMPSIGLVFGFILGIIEVLLYNLVSKFIQLPSI
jgi:hypothetical protein